jgi:molecular chaperone IbpA|tara:strand:+ start:166 stop:582 length:417 start_codon:yes stop_codon:yes gene_type:complete
MVSFEVDTFARQAIGFDRLFDVMNNIRGVDISYPPYDIIKKDEETYLIEFALSGFKKDDLNIKVKENNLTIIGTYGTGEGESTPEYLHKGIAKRSFNRDFVLADTLHVEDVTFNEGILRIILKQIIPEEQKPKTLKIN